MSRTLARWCLHEKTRSGARFIQGRLLDFVSRLHVCMFSFHRPMAHDQYDDTTLNRRKLTTHALPVVVHWQTDFKPNAFTWYPWYSAWYRYEISYRSEILTPVLLAPARHFVSVSCEQIHTHERKPEWARAGVKPRCHVNTPSPGRES